MPRHACGGQGTTLWYWFSPSSFVQIQTQVINLVWQVPLATEPAPWPRASFKYNAKYLGDSLKLSLSLSLTNVQSSRESDRM